MIPFDGFVFVPSISDRFNRCDDAMDTRQWPVEILGSDGTGLNGNAARDSVVPVTTMPLPYTVHCTVHTVVPIMPCARMCLYFDICARRKRPAVGRRNRHRHHRRHMQGSKIGKKKKMRSKTTTKRCGTGWSSAGSCGSCVCLDEYLCYRESGKEWNGQEPAAIVETQKVKKKVKILRFLYALHIHSLVWIGVLECCRQVPRPIGRVSYIFIIRYFSKQRIAPSRRRRWCWATLSKELVIIGPARSEEDPWYVYIYIAIYESKMCVYILRVFWLRPLGNYIGMLAGFTRNYKRR